MSKSIKCISHVRYVQIIDGERIVRCVHCHRRLELIPSDLFLIPRKLYTCSCGAILIGSRDIRVHKCKLKNKIKGKRKCINQLSIQN